MNTTDESTLEALHLNLVQRVNMGDALTRTAARLPDKEAIVDGERRVTYREFDESVNRLARGLQARGYQRHDALAIMSGNSLEFLLTYFACAKLGVVAVPISLVWRHQEIEHVLQHSRARGIVVEAQLFATLEPVLADCPDVTDVFIAPGIASAEDLHSLEARFPTLAVVAEGMESTGVEVFIEDRDPLSYMYTSGTTSAPKGVVSSHLALYLGSLTAAVEMHITADDRLSAMMPLFHIAQLNAFATPTLMVGGTLVMKRGFDAPGLLELVERERLTLIFGLPMMYRAMLDHPDIDTRDLTSLRRCGYAMAPIPRADLLRAMEKFGCEFSLGFGQTEMVPMTTIFQPEQQLTHHGSVGTQVVNIQIEIMGEDGTLLPRGQSGEIVYRGPHALEEYLRDPAATQAAVEGGWFHSGDLGHFGEDGVLWFEDRSKDVIKTGGENVASLEVERALYEAEPRIKEVAVVGLPHEQWIEAVTALVIPHTGTDLTEADVMAAAAGALTNYKRPKSAVIMTDFPRTATGKIQKNVLRDMLADHYNTRSTDAAADLR
jgi:acyl-CoA synthetase (AMP-forming)/AMP-acid ligase II